MEKLEEVIKKSASKKIIEQRSCVGCRKSQHKSEMIRVVKFATGEIKIDHTGKAQGRGAYICKSSECLKTAIKKKQFERAFKGKIKSEIYDNLSEIINAELNIKK